MSYFQQWYGREQWNQVGRAVCVPNSEAKDVVVFWGKGVRGARHVFSEDQTALVEEFQTQAVAA